MVLLEPELRTLLLQGYLPTLSDYSLLRISRFPQSWSGLSGALTQDRLSKEEMAVSLEQIPGPSATLPEPSQDFVFNQPFKALFCKKWEQFTSHPLVPNNWTLCISSRVFIRNKRRAGFKVTYSCQSPLVPSSCSPLRKARQILEIRYLSQWPF